MHSSMFNECIFSSFPHGCICACFVDDIQFLCVNTTLLTYNFYVQQCQKIKRRRKSVLSNFGGYPLCTSPCLHSWPKRPSKVTNPPTHSKQGPLQLQQRPYLLSMGWSATPLLLRTGSVHCGICGVLYRLFKRRVGSIGTNI